ncbi:MAG: peroxiredoxin-like family protein [Dichotomicrobium sp.]
MTRHPRLLPRTPAPDLRVPTVAGSEWDLSQRRAERFIMVNFYRGLHCPICSKYLGELNRQADEFTKRGVDTLVVSTDPRDRAERAKEEWGLDKLTVGYGLSLEDARCWNLYISSTNGTTSMGVDEPRAFSEPGLFLMKPDRTLYFISIQSMPFARPNWRELLGALDFVIEKDYPARGEVPLSAAA